MKALILFSLLTITSLSFAAEEYNSTAHGESFVDRYYACDAAKKSVDIMASNDGNWTINSTEDDCTCDIDETGNFPLFQCDINFTYFLTSEL